MERNVTEILDLPKVDAAPDAEDAEIRKVFPNSKGPFRGAICNVRSGATPIFVDAQSQTPSRLSTVQRVMRESDVVYYWTTESSVYRLTILKPASVAAPAIDQTATRRSTDATLRQ